MAIKQKIVDSLRLVKDSHIEERKAVVAQLQTLKDQKTSVQASIDALTTARDAIDADLLILDSTIADVQVKAP